ncbi:nucleotidyltransferase domain-containing protein [Candidatus Bathyarchaeota archaeon]|nr:MAG: nucleotidyltransferase domain-containing protein [Candidatus Bathyarchaeota archaeon]
MSIKYHEIAVDMVAEKLRKTLSTISEVKIAVLFGSALRREFVRDVDVGVYLDPSFELKDLVKLANLLEDVLRIPVDVVPLEKAPTKLALKALLEGVRLVVKDKKLFWLLVTQALSEAMDMEIKFKELEKANRTKVDRKIFDYV